MGKIQRPSQNEIPTYAICVFGEGEEFISMLPIVISGFLSHLGLYISKNKLVNQ